MVVGRHLRLGRGQRGYEKKGVFAEEGGEALTAQKAQEAGA